MLNLLQRYLIIGVSCISCSSCNIITQIVIKLWHQLLNSDYNQHWQNISINLTDIFYCGKRLLIIWTLRVYFAQNIHKNHLIFLTYIYAKPCFIDVPLICRQYANLINHRFVCFKVPHQQLKIIYIFLDCSYKFLPNFKQVFLPLQPTFGPIFSNLRQWLSTIHTNSKKRVYSRFYHI